MSVEYHVCSITAAAAGAGSTCWAVKRKIAFRATMSKSRSLRTAVIVCEAEVEVVQRGGIPAIVLTRLRGSPEAGKRVSKLAVPLKVPRTGE